MCVFLSLSPCDKAEAERKKRASILDSEGSQQSEINVADGQRQATILAAQGEAAAILAKAEATARGIDLLAEAIKRGGGRDAVGLRIAEQYVEAFGKIAKEGNTMLIPSNVSEPSSMIAQALAIYGQVMNRGGMGAGGAERGRGETEGEGRDQEQSGYAGVGRGSAGGYGSYPPNYPAPTGAPSYFATASTQQPSALFPAGPPSRPTATPTDQRKQ